MMNLSLKRPVFLLLLVPGFLLMGCSETPGTSSSGVLPAASGDVPPSLVQDSLYLVDVTSESGVRFTHFNSASTRKLLPETMGAGVAVADFDVDGLPDLYFVNGSSLDQRADRPTGELYRNAGDGRFIDVTKGSGLDSSFFGMGVAVGDFENDGLADLAVSAVDKVRLFSNIGSGRFEEVTERLEQSCPGFGSSVAFLDYDRDGFLDLFVGRYVEWSLSGDIPCHPDGVHQTYCTPEVYPGITNCLFRNVGGKRFEDVSRESGIASLPGKALGVAVVDYLKDGWPDVAVANDTVANFLFVNQGNGTFREDGVAAGLAFSESGAARGGMGIDSGDLDGDGFTDVVVGNFSQEMIAFFRAVDGRFFIDDAAPAGLGLPTLMTLTFGTLVEDLDSDGWLDVLLVNGHIEPAIDVTRRSQSYEQPPQFFRNLGEGHFEQLGDQVIRPPNLKLVARGFASGDFDRDGDLDFVVTQNGRRAVLLRNENSNHNNWLQLKLEGRGSNAFGFGASVELTLGERTVRRYLSPARSYLSSCEPILHLGLGPVSTVPRISISWPSGEIQELKSVRANRRLTIREGEEITEGS